MEFNLVDLNTRNEQLPEEFNAELPGNDHDNMVGWCHTLLDKYYEGKTSLSEENLLRYWLGKADDLPDDLVAEAAIFNAMQAVAAESTEIELRVVTRERKERLRRRNKWLSIASVAAATTICVNVALAGEQTYGYINGNPIRDSEMAMEQMQVAMSYLAEVQKSMVMPTESAKESLEQVNRVLEYFK